MFFSGPAQQVATLTQTPGAKAGFGKDLNDDRLVWCQDLIHVDPIDHEGVHFTGYP